MLCPTLPEELRPADWNHNVHADSLAFFFRSLDYLRNRVAGNGPLNLLAVLQNPTESEVAEMSLPGFAFAGFDLVDVRGDISALTNCGGFEGVFLKESHAECHVWAIWRQRLPAGS